MFFTIKQNVLLFDNETLWPRRSPNATSLEFLMELHKNTEVYNVNFVKTKNSYFNQYIQILIILQISRIVLEVKKGVLLSRKGKG